MKNKTEPFDLIVLGGGSGGIATANRAASYGARVLLIEKKRLGGTCVNVGCVPKKVMWNAAHAAGIMEDAYAYGFHNVDWQFDWAHLKKGRDAYVARLNEIYQINLNKNGVTVVQGEGRLVARDRVKVNDEEYTGRHILIATGGRPKIPDIPGAEFGISSDGFFELESQPKHVAVVGSGYIGVELTGVFASLGSQVCLFSKDNDILKYFDSMLSVGLQEEMENLQITIERDMKVLEVKRDNEGLLSFVDETGMLYEGYDCLVWAIGREPASDCGLADVGVELDEAGFCVVDEYQATSVPNIYAVGDIGGKMPLTPVAIAAGRKLADRLFGGQPEAKLEYAQVPSVVFSHPPLSTVGLTEKEAVEQHGSANIKCYETSFVNMYYALGKHKVKSRIKLVTLLPDEKILGVHIFGLGADEMIQGVAIAVKMGATKVDFDRTVAVHPTAAEELVLMR